MVTSVPGTHGMIVTLIIKASALSGEKTSLCAGGSQHFSEDCQYAHGEEELEPRAVLSREHVEKYLLDTWLWVKDPKRPV